MADNRRDTMQRIQVGIVGLVSVLLLVGVANFVVENASDEQSAAQVIQAEQAIQQGQSPSVAAKIEEAPPAEPLAELGITPAPEPEEAQEAAPATLPSNGQIVPDLEPDPKLEAPMDQEQ